MRRRALKSFQKGPLVHILSGGRLPAGVKFPDALTPHEEPYRLFKVQVTPGRIFSRPGFKLHEISVSSSVPDLTPDRKALVNLSKVIGTGETALVVYPETIGLLRPFGPHHRLVEIYARNDRGHMQVFGHPEEPAGQARVLNFPTMQVKTKKAA